MKGGVARAVLLGSMGVCAAALVGAGACSAGKLGPLVVTAGPTMEWKDDVPPVTVVPGVGAGAGAGAGREVHDPFADRAPATATVTTAAPVAAALPAPDTSMPVAPPGVHPMPPVVIEPPVMAARPEGPGSLPAPDPAALKRAEAEDQIIKALLEIHDGKRLKAKATLALALSLDLTLGRVDHAVVVGSVSDEYELVRLMACGKSGKGHYDVRGVVLTKTTSGRWTDQLQLGCKYDATDARVFYFDVSAFFGRAKP